MSAAYSNSHSAFPRGDQSQCEPEPGMSLRDYFAAKALPECLAYWRTLDDTTAAAVSYAQLAYDAADAMLKAREQ